MNAATDHDTDDEVDLEVGEGDPESIVRPILETLGELRVRGQPLLDRLAVEQLAMVNDCMANDGTGKIVVELTYKPNGSTGETMIVAATVTAKPPKPKAEGMFFFVDGNNQLRTEHPRQGSLFRAGRREDPTE